MTAGGDTDSAVCQGGRGEDDAGFVRHRKPDGGWGWAVTFGVFIVYVITTGSSWAFGILYIAFLDAFNESKAVTAVPGSLIFMTMVVTNPYAGLLADKYGHRPIIFVGGALSTLAIFASSFATDFTMLTIMYGLVGGFGFGLSHLPAVVMLSHYFDKKIGTATGLAMSGTGLGTIFMSVVTQMLVSTYGWRGTMLVLSAINANLCVAAVVMRPVKFRERCRKRRAIDTQLVVTSAKEADAVAYHNISQEDKLHESMNITSNPVHDQWNSVERTGQPLSGQSSSIAQNTQLGSADNAAVQTLICGTAGMSQKAKEAELDASRQRCGGFVSHAARFLDSVYGFALWKNPLYVSFLLGVNLAFFGMTIVSAHVAKRALEFGLSEMESSSLLAIIGLSQAVGRVVSGPLVDRRHLNPLRLYQSMTALCGISIVVSVYLRSYPGQIAFCLFAGYTTGACATLQTVMCVSLFGHGLMKYTYPGVILAVGIAMLSSPPMAGLCRDLQGNYVAAFLMAAASCLSSVVAHIPLSCVTKSGKTHGHQSIPDDVLDNKADLTAEV